MRIWISLLAVCSATLATAQIKMTVIRGGRDIGVATLTQKVQADGGKVVQISMEMKTGDSTVKVRSESTYRSDGSPIRKFQEALVIGQRYRRQVIASFGSNSVNVVTDTNGQRQTEQLSFPDGASLANESEFWFIREVPKVGQSVSSSHFNLDKMTWAKVSTKYIGPKSIKVNGKTVTAHLMQNTLGSVYVDDKGLPIRLELPDTRMDRIW